MGNALPCREIAGILRLVSCPEPELRLHPQDTRKMLDRILGTPDVAEIFARAYAFLSDNRNLFLCSIRSGDGAGLDTTEKKARESWFYTETFSVLRGAFEHGVLRAMRSSSKRQRTRLPDEIRDWVFEELYEKLVSAEPQNVFSVLLGLMTAIDWFLYGEVRDAFYARRRNGRAAVPLPHHRAFPKPVGPLGVDDMARKHLLEGTGEFPDFLELERYFINLALAPQPNRQRPSPALHVDHDERRLASGPWRVAMLSILADVKEVDWQKAGDVFWATSVAPRARPDVSRRLAWALGVCRREKADLVVIPELNLDAEMSEVVRRELEGWSHAKGRLFPMVVVGRLHQPADDIPDMYHNRPEILTPRGALRWDYSKAAPSDWKEDGLKRWEALRGRPPHVVAVDTPMGRLAVVICKDFLEYAVRDALVNLRANVVVVLSMTTVESINRFYGAAAELAASNQAITVFCNSSVHLRSPTRSERGFWPLGFVYPNTRGVRRPLRQHHLTTAAYEATVAMYSLDYSLEEALTARVRTWRL